MAVERVPIESLSLEPRVISPAELDNFASTVGNHEGKAIAYLEMQRSVLWPDTSLHHAIRSYDHSEEPLLTLKKIRSYLETFESRGLVTRISPEDGELVDSAIKPTVYGRSALPLVGLLLDYSHRHPDINLHDVFGGTASSIPSGETVITEDGDEIALRRGSAGIRIAIFRTLLHANSPMRESDLAAQLGIDEGTINRHVINLGKSGIIQADSIGADLRLTYEFTKNPDQAPLVIRPSLRQDVYDFARNRKGAFTVVDVRTYLIDTLGMNGETLLDASIVQALHFLQQSNGVSVVGLGGSTKTGVYLSAEQRAKMGELIDLIDGYQSGNKEKWEMGQRAAQGILSDQDAIATLIEKAVKRSPTRRENRIDPDVMDSIMLQVLRANPGITPNEFHSMLIERLPVPVSVGHARFILSKAHQRGLVTSVKNPGGIRGWKVKTDRKSKN